MIRSWVQQQGGADPRVGIVVLTIVSAFFLWTLWRVFHPGNRDHFDRIGAFPLDDSGKGERS